MKTTYALIQITVKTVRSSSVAEPLYGERDEWIHANVGTFAECPKQQLNKICHRVTGHGFAWH